MKGSIFMREKLGKFFDITLSIIIFMLIIILIISFKKPKSESELFIENFKYTISENEVYIVSANSEISEITIPETVNINRKKYTVTKILDNAFADNSFLIKIVLPNSITSIGDNAFKNCTKLSSITIPEKCNFIGKNAFYNCVSVQEINYNSTCDVVKTPLSGEIFNNVGKENAVKIVFGKDVKNIPSYLFATIKSENAINIDSIDFKTDKCLQIGEGSFINAKINKLELPEQISVFGSDTFKGSTISEITIKGNPEFLPDYMFYNCKNLQQIFIPESVKIIGVRCFAESGLISINLSENTQYIGMSAFNNSKLQIINYNGSKDMWGKININVDKSEEFMNAKITFVES